MRKKFTLAKEHFTKIFSSNATVDYTCIKRVDQKSIIYYLIILIIYLNLKQ